MEERPTEESRSGPSARTTCSQTRNANRAWRIYRPVLLSLLSLQGGSTVLLLLLLLKDFDDAGPNSLRRLCGVDARPDLFRQDGSVHRLEARSSRKGA